MSCLLWTHTDSASSNEGLGEGCNQAGFLWASDDGLLRTREVNLCAVEGSFSCGPVVWRCSRLGRGCSRPRVSQSRSLHPHRTHNRSGVRWEERRTTPRSDCQRRWPCLSEGKTSQTVRLVKMEKQLFFYRFWHHFFPLQMCISFPNFSYWSPWFLLWTLSVRIYVFRAPKSSQMRVTWHLIHRHTQEVFFCDWKILVGYSHEPCFYQTLSRASFNQSEQRTIRLQGLLREEWKHSFPSRKAFIAVLCSSFPDVYMCMLPRANRDCPSYPLVSSSIIGRSRSLCPSTGCSFKVLLA